MTEVYENIFEKICLYYESIQSSSSKKNEQRGRYEIIYLYEKGKNKKGLLNCIMLVTALENI